MAYPHLANPQLPCAPTNLPTVWTPILRILELHPKYHREYINTVYCLFYGVSNIDLAKRHYVALMAATRHRSEFLIDLHQREYVRAGGNMDWLNGISRVDDYRITGMDKLNMMLAHQPWLLNATVVDELFRSSVPGKPRWSPMDVVLLSEILIHTHSTASFVAAVGNIHPWPQTKREEEELRRQQSLDMVARFEWEARDKENRRKGEIEELLTKMKIPVPEGVPNVEMNEKIFDALTDGYSDEARGGASPDRSDLPVFSNNLSFSYLDFALRQKHLVKTYKAHEFTWEHGYSVIEDLSRELAASVDRKTHVTQSLTYGFMGDNNYVDTTPYRTAIWNYIQALFGIRHDDYDYSTVNQLISREMKTFVKTVACYPHKMTDNLRQAVMSDFKASEKVHVVMMIMESRIQATNLWFTRSLSNYHVLTNTNIATRALD